MPTTLRLRDNGVESLLDTRDFEYLIMKHMGYDSARYFRELMNEVDEEKQELRSARTAIENQTLYLISQIRLLNESDREEIAEEFKAIMEDIFGLEEL